MIGFDPKVNTNQAFKKFKNFKLNKVLWKNNIKK